MFIVVSLTRYKDFLKTRHWVIVNYVNLGRKSFPAWTWLSTGQIEKKSNKLYTHLVGNYID